MLCFTLDLPILFPAAATICATTCSFLVLPHFFLITGQPLITKGMVDMKIVDEPSSYGFNNNNQQWGGLAAQEERLKMRVKPANVSGPPHLLHLKGHCFTKILNSYKYEFCPYYNVTQHEQSYHWNPYKGVLGVWQEWEVENNTFLAMEMREGDNCGQFHRSVKVVFVCGNTSEITNVSEPHTCHYVLIFSTPFVCHPQAMLVYPILSSELQHQWDILEGKKERMELTEKGYKKRLDVILQAAGLRLSSAQKLQLASNIGTKEENRGIQQTVQFRSLLHCSQEYQKTKQELEQLKLQLTLLQGLNNTDNEHDKFLSDNL